MASGVDSQGKKLRTWRAGRSDLQLHLLTVFSLAVAFVCLAASLLVVTNIAALRDRWSRAGRATVYLRDNATDAESQDVLHALESTPFVKKVRLVTSVEARREVLADESDKSFAALPASAFPASLEVGFTDEVTTDALETTALKLRAIPCVESVETYAKWTERLSSLLGGGVTASLCLAVVVLGAVVSVIGSTLRLLLHRRKAEVEVLKLVGATDAFVRRPFVVEATAQGAGGALAALLMLGALFVIVRGRFDVELVSLLGVPPSFLPWPVALAMVLLGAGLGAATAIVSLRKMVMV
ncbi:MAG: permease-like cell division protein FtsX [Polyangiaceae bacterium]